MPDVDGRLVGVRDLASAVIGCESFLGFDSVFTEYGSAFFFSSSTLFGAFSTVFLVGVSVFVSFAPDPIPTSDPQPTKQKYTTMVATRTTVNLTMDER